MAGFGVFFYANGSKYEGFWKENKKVGKALFINEHGQNQKCEFNDDKVLYFKTVIITD